MNPLLTLGPPCIYSFLHPPITSSLYLPFSLFGANMQSSTSFPNSGITGKASNTQNPVELY